LNVAIITGASSGMGREFALQMDAGLSKIDEFWLVARDEARLKELGSCLKHKSRIFSMDVTSPGQLERLKYAAKLESACVRMLVCCAGMGQNGFFTSLPIKDTKKTIRLNCEALTETVGETLPFMKRNSRIIILSSASAFLPQPGFAVYAASKSYVLSFSRALGQELKGRGIIVTAVCPGPVDTPFLEKAGKTGESFPLKKYFIASPEAVVEKALRDSLHKKSVSIYGISMKALSVAAKLVPNDLIFTGMRLFQKG